VCLLLFTVVGSNAGMILEEESPEDDATAAAPPSEAEAVHSMFGAVSQCK
jgi:hypothetical protein